MELHTSFTTFDYVVIGCVLLSGLLALMRGLVREVCSLAAWAGAFVAAAKLSYLVEPWAHKYLKSDSLASNAAMIATFFAALIILSLVGMLICRLVQGDALTAIDRSLGFVFGLLRGALLVCLLYLVAMSTFWPDLDLPDSANLATLQAGGQSVKNDLSMPPPIAKGPTQQAEERSILSSSTGGVAAESAPPQVEWLKQAKTRPFLAQGARWLRSLLPANSSDIVKEKRGALERRIERDAQDLILRQGTAGHSLSSGSSEHSHSYDDKSRSGISDLIDVSGGTP